MRTEGVIKDFWRAQAGSLPFAAACREHAIASFARHVALMRPASCRAVQAGSLRSPNVEFHHK
jgi:hypothetical protein